MDQESRRATGEENRECQHKLAAVYGDPIRMATYAGKKNR